MNDLLWRASNFASDALAKDALNAGRASLLLDPVSSLAEHIFGDGTIVIAADELLFPPDLAWEGRYRYANFLYYDDPRPLDPKLDAWLKAGEAPVFVGFGSMSGDGIDRVSALLTEAIVATGKRCLVGAGWAGLGAGDLPKGWRVVEEAPHALLFPRTAVVVPARAPRPMRSARVFLKSSSRSFSTSFTTRTGCTLRGFRRGRRRWRASPPRSSPPPSPSPSRSRKAREKRSPIVCVAPTVRGRS
jgi:hypothetical protein